MDRSSFEIVDVASLPEVGRGKPMPLYEQNWRDIASASVRAIEEGDDPLEHDAIRRRGVALGLTADDVDRLVDLFREPITWSERIVLNDGAHRVHALRGAGVERVVVYTGKRELDAQGLWQDAD